MRLRFPGAVRLRKPALLEAAPEDEFGRGIRVSGSLLAAYGSPPPGDSLPEHGVASSGPKQAKLPPALRGYGSSPTVGLDSGPS